MPAYTFRATWTAAARTCYGYNYGDVSPDTWRMGLRADASPRAVYVAAFGAPVPEARSGDVIDAAGAFGNQGARDCPVVISLHATKALPAGEGGFVLTRDKRLAAEVRRLSNFGFPLHWHGGANAKMSEYHAAVALAALNTWSERAAKYLALRARYLRNLSGQFSLGITYQAGAASIVSPIMPVCVSSRRAVNLVAPMASRGIEVRAGWYEAVEVDDNYPVANYPVAVDLARHVLGLPMGLHLSESDVDRVCEALIEEVAA
jgi:dTDP-4-amino-4,6-dideoxygalactose transaminase